MCACSYTLVLCQNEDIICLYIKNTNTVTVGYVHAYIFLEIMCTSLYIYIYCLCMWACVHSHECVHMSCMYECK